MGPTPPHLDREHHRKLTSASSAVVTNAGALSTKTSSSSGRKERIARASNVSPAGKAVIVRERRQNAVEPNIDRVDTISTSNSDTTAAAEHNCNGDRATAEQLERGTIAASALTTIPLLPALQMEGEEEPPIVDATLALSEVTTDIVLKNPSLSSSPPPQLTAGPVQILSSPLTAASHPQTPPPPLTQKAPSAVVCQVSETAFITTCSLQKEVVHAATQAQRQGTTEARLTKPPAVAVLVTTSAYTPPAYLSATPRIFRALRDVTNPRVLAPQQQQQKSAPQVETKSAGEEQQRPTEVLAASVPVTLRESELVDVIPNNTAEESSEAPSTLTIGSVKDGQKAQQRQQKQQPFRKKYTPPGESFGYDGHQNTSNKGQGPSGHARFDDAYEGAQGFLVFF
ncbi:hypothetical protein EC991_010615 [Linnemannia zychae]|nr:hypothetical protein EC991_010615 [Linnemannia zychae]